MKNYCLAVALFLVFAAQLAEISADCEGKGAHDAFWGSRYPNDRLVYEKKIKMDSKLLRKQSTDVEYPPKGHYNDFPISRIELLDQDNDGTGGCGYLSNGGVGQTSVKIHLKTQRGEGLKFIVKIYTRN